MTKAEILDSAIDDKINRIRYYDEMPSKAELLELLEQWKKDLEDIPLIDQDEVKQMEEEIFELHEKVDDLESERDQLQDKVDELQERLDAL